MNVNKGGCPPLRLTKTGSVIKHGRKRSKASQTSLTRGVKCNTSSNTMPWNTIVHRRHSTPTASTSLHRSWTDFMFLLCFKTLCTWINTNCKVDSLLFYALQWFGVILHCGGDWVSPGLITSFAIIYSFQVNLTVRYRQSCPT